MTHFIGSVFQSTLASVNIQALPDKGQKLFKQIQELEEVLSALALSPEQGKRGSAPELGVCMNFTRYSRALSMKKRLGDFLRCLVVRTSPSNAGGTASVPDRGDEIPDATWPHTPQKTQNLKRGAMEQVQ